MSGALTSLLSQNFSTIKGPNLRLALYTLSIRSPGFSALSFFTYTFPLSPNSIRKSFPAMSAMYDTAGSPLTSGVRRNFDDFGIAPVMYSIEGTTGVDRHSTDGYLFTGLQSIQQLQFILNTYAALNQQQKLANNPALYTLEFYDYFNGEYWQVQPIGDQDILQSERAPLLQYYRIRLAGIQPVSAPLISDIFADPIQQLFAAGAGAAASTVAGAINSVLVSY